MIAWWIRAGAVLVGDDALGVRLLPALSSLLTTLIVHDLGRMAGRERTGFRAALLYNCTLTVGAGGALAIPDVAAGLFWTATLWAMAKIAKGGDWRWWLAAGAAAGLAALSKYSALFLAPAAILWLVVSADGRKALRGPWPWIAAVLALAIFSGNIGWNAAHHWETFAKQFGRAAPHRLAPNYLVEFIAGQFVLLNPAVAILAGVGVLGAWRARTQPSGQVVWLMLAAILPFLAYLLVHSLHDRVQAHWPVPLYSAAAVLAAWAAEGAMGWRAGLARWAPVGLGLCVLALAHAALPWTDLGKGDPALQLRGWTPFAQDVEAARLKDHAAWVGALSYGVSAQLQARRQSPAPILQLNERDRYVDLPPPAAPDLAKPGLVVDLLRRINPAALKACFDSVGILTEIDRGRIVAKDGRYGAVRVSGPKIDVLGRGCGN
jgi:4-amino-4-deoxy-L-arabinose transferase-like glycosyltransferase